MKLRNRRPKIASAVLTGLLVVIQLAGCKFMHARSEQPSDISRIVMSQTEAVCAGRFTLHLPAPIDGGFSEEEFNGVELSWRPLQAPGLVPAPDPWKQHVERVRTEQGKAFASADRILKNYMLGARHALFYQYVPSDDSPYILETWSRYGDRWLVSSFSGSKEDFTVIEKLTVNVLDHFVPTSDRQPLGAAFCLQSGAIHLSPDQGEHLNAHWNLPDNYELTFRTVVVETPSQIVVAENARKTAAKSLATAGSHYTLIRAGNRTVLGMAGQEAVSYYRNDPSPTNFYTADFAFGGVADKGSRPAFQLSLSAYDKPGQKVDRDAFLKTWNAILQTVEVRLHD
jgi:hypothetical protein